MEIQDGLSVIVANPPYIPTRHLTTLPPEVRDFEPHLALDGGDDGLTFYRQLLRDALGFLQPGGSLVLELGKARFSPSVKRLNSFQAGIFETFDKMGRELIV